MILLVNSNRYLGGGETLLLRFASYLDEINLKYTVVCSKSSYISNKLPSSNCELFSYNIDYRIYNSKLKNKSNNFLSNLIVNFNEVKIVTFTFKDLLWFLDSVKGVNCQFKHVHLLLHPYDHLYSCKGILDKILNVNYSESKQFRINKKIIENLNSTDRLVSMNKNVTTTIKYFFDVEVRNIIPLPVVDNCSINTNTRESIINKDLFNIVWLGRIVDFKIPSIVSMIEFVAKNKNYHFYIIGTGNETAIRKVVKKHEVEDRVVFLGLIDYNNLINEISKYDIGYAMGTSAVELVKFGLPTLVATASPNFRSFNKLVCSGVIWNQELGNLGDDLYCKENINLYSIEEELKNIVNDLDESFLHSFEYIKLNHSEKSNFDRYLHCLSNSTCFNYESNEILNDQTLFKRILGYFLSLYKK